MARPRTSQRITIHQYHANIAPKDAISNQMFFIQRTLAEAEIGGEIFGKTIDKNLQDQALSMHSIPSWNCDLMLIHHSQGDRGLKKVLRMPVAKALVYHNITPEKYFSHDLYLRRLSKLGRRQLTDIRDKVIASFADSEFNAEELKRFGFLGTRVLPLLDLTLPEFRSFSTSAPSRWKYSKSLLFVGRLAPHKNQALLIKTLYYLNTYFRGRYQLVLVGGDDVAYGYYLRKLTKALGMTKNVLFTGRVSQAELLEYYHRADAFVCTSLHEGFCVPLVEAMRSDLPIFALPTSAVKDTLNGAGVTLGSAKPHEIAEIINAVLEEPQYENAALASQQKQFERLRQIQNPARVQKLCGQLVQQLRRSPQNKNKCIENTL